jgi:hypothetical protein
LIILVDDLGIIADHDPLISVISGLLTPIGKTSREALISYVPTKFVVKIFVNLRCSRFYQNKWNDNPEKGMIDVHPERFTPWFKMQWGQLRRKLVFDAAELGLS